MAPGGAGGNLCDLGEEMINEISEFINYSVPRYMIITLFIGIIIGFLIRHILGIYIEIVHREPIGNEKRHVKVVIVQPGSI